MSNLSPERLLRSGQALWSAYLLQAALELGVFSELGRGPRTRAQLQRRLSLREPGVDELLDALVGLGWLEREGDDDQAVYLNSREAGHYLDARSAVSFGHWLRDAFVMATPAAQSLVSALRGDTPWPSLPLPEPALHAWAALVGDALAQRLSFAGDRMLLGHGAGAAHTLCALAAALPHLHAQALVAPHDLASARDHIGASGLSGRVRAQVRPDRGSGADAVAVNRWWPASDRNEGDLAAARAALRAGGRLLWVDHWLDDTRRHSAPALMAVLRRRLAGDAPHTDTVQAAHERCLAAGFGRTEWAPLCGGLSVVQAFV